jgi:pimeloyl-ACP methyl ester carboxylesterase
MEKTVRTKTLEIAYKDEGPEWGPVIFLLHGWPDDVRAWKDIAPLLHAAGYRTITPWLRGFGPTLFLSGAAVRDGRAVALAQDVIDLADALVIDTFHVMGHDWGARTAYTLAALFPERTRSIVTMAVAFQPNGLFKMPDFSQARLFWYQWLMYVDDGAAKIRRNPVDFARIQWDTWSPAGWYKEEEFKLTARSFENSDFVPITLSGYRSRFMSTQVDPAYDELQRQLGLISRLSTPTLLIQGAADTCDDPVSSEDMDQYFTGGYRRILLPRAGHFVPREAPDAVAAAAIEHLAGLTVATTGTI